MKTRYQVVVAVTIIIALTYQGYVCAAPIGANQPQNLTGYSRQAPRVSGLSELEKANNALARVMGRTLPHPVQTIIVIDSGQAVIPVIIK